MKIERSSLRWRSLVGRESADPFEGLEHRDLSARIVRIDAGSRRNPHVHAGTSEAIYIVKGTGHFWADGSARRVGPGDCILVPPDVPHATVPDADSQMELVCFWPHPDGAATTRELEGTIQLTGETRDD